MRQRGNGRRHKPSHRHRCPSPPSWVRACAEFLLYSLAERSPTEKPGSMDKVLAILFRRPSTPTQATHTRPATAVLMRALAARRLLLGRSAKSTNVCFSGARPAAMGSAPAIARPSARFAGRGPLTCVVLITVVMQKSWRSLIRTSRHRGRSPSLRRSGATLGSARAPSWSGTRKVRKSWFVEEGAIPLRTCADCLMLEVARKAGHLPLGTFDRNLGKLEGAERL